MDPKVWNCILEILIHYINDSRFEFHENTLKNLELKSVASRFESIDHWRYTYCKTENTSISVYHIKQRFGQILCFKNSRKMLPEFEHKNIACSWFTNITNSNVWTVEIQIVKDLSFLICQFKLFINLMRHHIPHWSNLH